MFFIDICEQRGDEVGFAESVLSVTRNNSRHVRLCVADARRQKFAVRMRWSVVIAVLLPLLMEICSGFTSHAAPFIPSARNKLARSIPLLDAVKHGTTWRERFHSGPVVLEQPDNTITTEVDNAVLKDDSLHENDVHDETATGTSDDNTTNNETENDLLTLRKQAAARISLLSNGSFSQSRTSPSKSTSVGQRRIGSVTLGLQGTSTTSKIMDVLRKTAQGVTSNEPSNGEPSNGKPSTSASEKRSSQVTQSVIHDAVDEILRNREARAASVDDAFNINAAFSYFGKSIGILGDATHEAANRPTRPSDLLLNASRDDRVSIRLASPVDDMDIATLRLSVFSDFVPDLQAQFCARSCQAIAARRLRGSTCIVATQPFQESSYNNHAQKVLGSAECSFHEFFGTQLGQRRAQKSILYLTEVAVTPGFHRQGIGSKLLRAVDIIAERRGVETLYLHVDVKNHGALRLYEKAGYRVVYSTHPMFLDFTTSLNLHPGATRGRVHFLLYKNLVSEPVWLEDENDQLVTPRPLMGSLGIEIPA